MTMTPGGYRYTQCGLDNVVLVGLPVKQDDAGEIVITIPNVRLLHRVIATELAKKEVGLTPKEIRFLRTEIGFTQSDLAKVVHKDHQTVGRWERGETPIEPTAEIILRMLVLEKHEATERPKLGELSQDVVPGASSRPLTIDAHDPTDYRPLAA